MSADPSPPPSPTETVKGITEKSASFIQWLAELIRRRNWFTLLLLVWVALILFCTPDGIVAQFLNNVFSLDITETFPQYPTYFWLVVGLIPIMALVLAVRSIPVQTVTEADTSERKAIKGLRPFTANDAEIFTKLQRNRSLRECLESITSENFRFGILMGESGCGKTSFLQAGLVPQLSDPEADYRAVYVRFSNRLPLNAIREDLSKQLHIPKENLDSTNLVILLQTAIAAIDQPLILFFDQFEQFFVHAARKPDRQLFIQALTDWYQSDLPVRVLVCMRGDMVDRLVELHQALGYALSPQEVFRLEKFSPEEATRVLQVIAETEKLRFEESFVKELTQRELADREDGCISPVDLQILGWMIERQNVDELRAFNQQAFQKFGGVEGLMTRFLEKTLEARVIKSQREAAVKVLLALTDLDRNVRTGALSLTEIQEKLKDTVKADEVAEAVRWLMRGDVRLITPEEKAEETVYELAHERLIPAVRKVSNKELTEVQKANELLDRRVNEWQGNQFSSRYLFSPIELCQLKRQQPYLEWGTNRKQKERLWQKSWRRLYRRIGALALVLLVLLSGWGWLLTPTGQRWQMWRELATVSQKVNDEGRATAVAIFAKNKNFQQANKLCDSIQSESYKAYALSSIAKIYSQLNNPQALEAFKDVLETAEDIEDENEQVEVMEAIVAAVDELNHSQNPEIFNNTLAIAKQMQDKENRVEALSVIAEGYGKSNYLQALEALNEALATTKQIQDETDRVDALVTVIEATGKLDHPQILNVLNDALVIARQVQNEEDRVHALSLVAGAYGVLNNPQALEVFSDTLNIAKQIQDETDRVDALETIADALGKLNYEQALELLKGILTAANQVQEKDYRADVLKIIVEAAGKLSYPQALEILNNALSEAELIQDERDRASVFEAIAEAVSRLDYPQSLETLNNALAMAEPIQNERDRANVLAAIAEAVGKLNHPQALKILDDTFTLARRVDDAFRVDVLEVITRATVKLNHPQALEILDDTFAIARRVQDEYDKAIMLRTIAPAYAKLNHWRQARQAVESCPSNSCRVESLAAALTVWAEQQHPELAEEEEE